MSRDHATTSVPVISHQTRQSCSPTSRSGQLAWKRWRCHACRLIGRCAVFCFHIRLQDPSPPLVLEDDAQHRDAQQDAEPIDKQPSSERVPPVETTVAPLTPDPRQRTREAMQPTPPPSARTNNAPQPIREEDAAVEQLSGYASAGLSRAPAIKQHTENTTLSSGDAHDAPHVMVEDATQTDDAARTQEATLADDATQTQETDDATQAVTGRVPYPPVSSTPSCAGSAMDERTSEAAQLLEHLRSVLDECRVLLDHKRARVERYAAKLHRGGPVEKLQRRRNKMERLSARVHVASSELEELRRFAERTEQYLTT